MKKIELLRKLNIFMIFLIILGIIVSISSFVLMVVSIIHYNYSGYLLLIALITLLLTLGVYFCTKKHKTTIINTILDNYMNDSSMSIKQEDITKSISYDVLRFGWSRSNS